MGRRAGRGSSMYASTWQEGGVQVLNYSGILFDAIYAMAIFIFWEATAGMSEGETSSVMEGQTCL